MRSGTSYFDPTLYKKTVNRFWPLWAVNLIFWLFVMPLRELMDLDPGSKSALRFALNVGDMATDVGIAVALLASPVVAMAVCSYLYNARSANFLGSLPCRREGQFLSTYAAGLTILIGPNVTVFLVTLLVEMAGGYVVWGPLLFWLGAVSAMEFFFFSFAVCLGQFTGHILALPVFYGVFNVLVVAFHGLLDWVLDVFYFGFAGFTGIWPTVVQWCTPVAMLSQMNIDATASGAVITVEFYRFWICAVYAAAGLALAVCAMLLHRRRQLETAGDIVAVRAMRPVFRYGVAICAGLFLGFLMQQMLGLSRAGFALWMVIWGVIGCFVAQMLLDKTIRVFKKWKGALTVAVVFLLMFVVVGFDLTGFESRVPAAEQVVSARISGLGGTPYGNGYSLSNVLVEGESAALVVDLHRRIVDNGPEGGPEAGQSYHVVFDVDYTLTDGSRLVRHYSVPMGEETLRLAQQLRDMKQLRRQAYRLDELEQQLAAGGYLEQVRLWSDGKYSAGGELSFAKDRDVQRLWAAVMEDFDAGRIGAHTVGEREEQSSLRVEFCFRVPVLNQQTIPGGEASMPYEIPDAVTGWHSVYREFMVREESSSTIAVLRELVAWEKPGEPTLEDILAGNTEGWQ